MARKFDLFNFMEKKIEVAEISPVTQKMLDQMAFKELALHIGISYIANTLSKCEFKVYENGEEVKNKLYYMLNVSPNPNQNSSQFINQFIERYYYRGAALIVPHRGYIYCADNFDIEDDNPLIENTFCNVTFNCHQIKKKHRASDVFYIKLDDRNVKGLIDSLYMQYGEVISQALATFKRTNGAKYKLLMEQYQAGDARFKEVFENVIKGQLKSFLESDNAVYPQYKGLDLQEFSKTAPTNTADIIAMRKETFEVVGQALKIPLSMMYGNITNMNEIVKVYLSICIDPLADMISEELTRKYFTFDEWKAGCSVEIDTSCINHIDILEVADKVDKAISSGAASIDEIRKRLGWKPLLTEFSTAHWMTKNYALAEDMMTISEGSENK
ncbi:phage portal protein [Listeria monocytogenes]|nr:phage portal protein [Listeria monocytogenes]